MVQSNNVAKGLWISVMFLCFGILVFYFIGMHVWIPDLNNDIFKSDHLFIPALNSVILYVYIPIAAYCFIASELTGNYSQVDKIWPLAPILFSWFLTFFICFSEKKDTCDLKPFIISGLMTLWALRLMHQFYLKGGYNFPRIWEGEEDYRWKYVRKMPMLTNNRLLLLFFNLFFITIYQLTLLFLISGGVVLGVIMLSYRQNKHQSLRLIDYFISFFLLLFIFIEAVADRQQRRFQIEKFRRIQSGEKLTGSDEHYELGFKTTELFSYSRHPNFTCEQIIWVLFYCFTIDFETINLVSVGGLFNFSIVGCILLILLFLKSTDLTEDISSSKYPAYIKYQNNVARIVDLKLVAKKIFFGKNPDRNWIN
ncbi:uncharacterized protein LOC136076273 [Hydra vulgaris]|uniref:uncharacterized protein LOC136076273 n=1 Tax=Hydra vulgaris TaxID=6087 RepID=UPI0032EA486B